MHSLFMLVKLYLFKQEKTLESLTDLKEIKPVNSKKKKYQPLKLKLQYFGHLM